MSTADLPGAPLIECIPDPERIRDRLSQLFAEARLLRSLLRVAEQRRRQSQRQEVRHGR
jgi:hypothetical protein